MSATQRDRSATARARANIALCKYWGKSDVEANLPAVPSISLTLDPLVTETSVRFDEDLKRDELILDGSPAREDERQRAASLLDRVRLEAGLSMHARVESRNDFPTAAGLASSASGFAALAAAARAAAGLANDDSAVSAMARRASASAARSVFGGFVELPAGETGDDGLCATQIAPADHWPLRIVIAVTAEGRKAVGSTRGMTHTSDTSPYYESWVAAAPALADRIRQGILARDLPKVGATMEHSTFAMHACAMAADPALIYMLPATLAVVARARSLRDDDGIGVWVTMDAGPHVKALCHESDVARVESSLRTVTGVLRTLVTQPGGGVEVMR